MYPLCFPTKGIRLISPNSCVTLAIRVKLVRPIGLEECAMWDWGKGTWGGQGVAFGTVPVCVRVQERAGEEGLILVGMVVKEEIKVKWSLPLHRFSSSAYPLFLHHSSANSWQWDLHSSGSGNTLHWQWELILAVGTLS
nr:hypothetical protein [Tanacetum cinerariifolium]